MCLGDCLCLLEPECAQTVFLSGRERIVPQAVLAVRDRRKQNCIRVLRLFCRFECARLMILPPHAGYRCAHCGAGQRAAKPHSVDAIQHLGRPLAFCLLETREKR